MNVFTVLCAAKAKIDKKENWTQGAYARDRMLRLSDCASPEASCWCSVGAVWAVAPPGSEGAAFVPDAIDALHKVARAAGYTNAIGLNDSGRHDAVLRMYSEAIEATRPA